MILAVEVWDPLAWAILPRIELGPLSVSPHGLGIALGYFLGAQLMVRRARRFGGPSETDIWNVLFWALIGAIIGARVGYVLGHFSEVTDGGDDLLGIFRIYEGGISLLGGITGAILAGLPYMLRRNMGFWRTMDLAVPGLALGIVIGRVGDLIIGDHLGKPTDFVLGWRCLGEVGGEGPTQEIVYRQALEAGRPPSLGCFDITLHQTAFYDLISTALLLGVLLWVGRRARNLGLLTLIFAIWYSAMRLLTDQLRVDRRYAGLTGSQIVALVVGVVCLGFLLRYRGAPPWRRGALPPPKGSILPEPEAPSAAGAGATEAEDVGPGPVKLEDPAPQPENDLERDPRKPGPGGA